MIYRNIFYRLGEEGALPVFFEVCKSISLFRENIEMMKINTQGR